MTAVQLFASNHAGVSILAPPASHPQEIQEGWTNKGVQAHPQYLISSAISTQLPVHTHVHPKDISQPCTHMSNFKFTHPSGSIIFPPARRRARDSPKVCYLETNNIFPLARTEKWPTKDPSVCKSWPPQKENSQKHIAKASGDKTGNMTDKICDGKLIEFEREL